MHAEMAAKIGAQVRRARKAHDWTGEQLAQRAGVAGGTIVRIENGRPVRPGNLSSVLDALNIPPISDTPAEVDDNVKLALDIIEKTLLALPDDQRDQRVRDLIRYVTLGGSDAETAHRPNG